MRGYSKPLVLLLAIVLMSLTTQIGCTAPARRSIRGSSASSSSEPALTTEPTDSAVATIDDPPASTATPPPKQLGFVDRHPLFRKPQQYYDNTNSNKAVKTAAAAFVGVPSGLFGELKQIVVGTPSSAPPAY